MAMITCHGLFNPFVFLYKIGNKTRVQKTDIGILIDLVLARFMRIFNTGG